MCLFFRELAVRNKRAQISVDKNVPFAVFPIGVLDKLCLDRKVAILGEGTPYEEELVDEKRVGEPRKVKK